MKIINFVQNFLGELNFGTSRRSQGIDILASAANCYYKSKSKTRNFWDKACFLLIDDSWNHKSDSELFEESFQFENEIIPFFEKDVIGEYAFINSDSHYDMYYLGFPWWPPRYKLDPMKLNKECKYVQYKLQNGYFAKGHLNKGFKLMTVMIIVSEIDWSLIQNIPENILVIYDERKKQINFPDSNTRIKASFQEIKKIDNNQD